MRTIFSRGDPKTHDNGSYLSTSKATHLKVLIPKRCLSPPSFDGNAAANGDDRLILRRFSYHKLPQQLFKLSVLKLDGSVFDVNVCRNATVGELKQAVEEVFTSSPKESLSKISWFLVWGHFCLSYEGQKLINDKTAIRNLGIKDGDQLQFVRHMSMNYSNSKGRARNKNAANRPYSTLSSENDVQEVSEQQSTLQHNSENTEDRNTNSCSNQLGEEENEEVAVPAIAEFKLAHFLRGWLTNPRSWVGSRRGSPIRTSRPSRLKSPLLGSGPKMIELRG